jgi:hypothetical protein
LDSCDCPNEAEASRNQHSLAEIYNNNETTQQTPEP